MSVTAFLRHAATRPLGKIGLSAACLLLGSAAFGADVFTAYAAQKDPGYYGTPLRFAPPPVDVSRGAEDMDRENIPRGSAGETVPARERSAFPVRQNGNTVRQTIPVPEAVMPLPAPTRPGRMGESAPRPAGSSSAPPVAVPTRDTPSPQSTKLDEETGGESAGTVQSPEPEQAGGTPSADPAAGGSQGDKQEAAGTPPVKSSAPAIRLFGTVDFRGVLKDLPKWERVLRTERRSPSFSSSGLACKSQSVQKRWLALKGQLEGASVMEKAKGVNRFFNQWPYKTDLMVWGVEDYWATPCEFVLKSGDCEDYAIAKYFALRELGVPAKIMRIAAVNDAIRGAGHAVLVIFLENDAYVLDNLTNMVLSHKKLKHYRPVYTVNEEYLWRHVKPVAGPKQ